MDALAFLQAYGREEAERVAKLAGTTFGYFEQLAYGYRKPRPELMWQLVKASNGRMTPEALRPDFFEDPESA